VKTRDQAMLIDRLQKRLGSGYGLPASLGSAAEAEIDRARKDLAEAEAALDPGRALPAEGDGRLAYEREIRALRARADDQAGEIARLKSALTAFEQHDGKAGGLRDSKIGLKARLGAAQAQSDQQANTIGKLRAELAAAHERLARQAAHFMEEMRRVGTGGAPNPHAQRRAAQAAERRGLAERVAQVRAATAEEKSEGAAPGGRPLEASVGNGHNGRAAIEDRRSDLAAAEMPKGPEIPGERRRSRLIDRITGPGKS
jgi:hypothetical protein